MHVLSRTVPSRFLVEGSATSNTSILHALAHHMMLQLRRQHLSLPLPPSPSLRPPQVLLL